MEKIIKVSSSLGVTVIGAEGSSELLEFIKEVIAKGGVPTPTVIRQEEI